MKMLNRMSAILLTTVLLSGLAGGCGNNNGKDSMTDDTTTFEREPDVEEPIDTNAPDDLRDDARGKIEKDSIARTPPVP